MSASATAGPRRAGGISGTAVGLTILAAALLVAILGPMLVPHDPLVQELAARNAPPDALHWLGRDHLGRDILARLAAGTRISLAVALGATLLAVLVGAGLGLAAEALGRWPSFLVFGAFDMVRALPSILLALTLMVALGVGMAPLILALGIAFAPHMALVARAAWRRESAAGYVAAARVMGAAPLATLRRHVLPNIAGALVTQASIIMPRAITTESVLSFFGLGVAPETPSWGRMISGATRFAEAAPHAVLAPVLALCLVTLGFALAGDRLRLALDPLRERGQ
ncbi:ABC transporter permease [Roseomonas frigidaquae]|uniref:ABC transporter permease n=1 Tax=Falsiroseomonas frigidaquae TaxID=487318 RepID=A0ABX1ET96_9PROT|nr:ABC transporter permease [Falsiroseomonas frigidaquae]NKE43855.1 ABC transporter permease [Falsiroseomonas frigidaquae]